MKVAGTWRYVYRAVDEHGQVIDVFVSRRRDLVAARRFFRGALDAHGEPDEVVTDLAQALETVIEELIPKAFHNTEQYANNRVECDHGRLESRLRPMRGLKTDRTASVVIRGHAFVQNLRRGHYELGTETPQHHASRCSIRRTHRDNLTRTVNPRRDQRAGRSNNATVPPRVPTVRESHVTPPTLGWARPLEFQ